jgi:type IV pilus assembly protein PilW
MKRIPQLQRLRQRGLTLIELMVSMVLMLLITIATVALFNVSSSSFKTVDAGQELQDSARFAMEIIGQAVRSAGYQERIAPVTTDDQTDRIFGPANVDDSAWRVQGGDNSMLATGNSIARGVSNGVNQSDALITRFFGSNLANPNNPAIAQFNGGNPVADGTMVDCSGRTIPYPTGGADVGVSAFFVRTVNGEPELICKSYNPTTGQYVDTQIVRGVETFQVMFGVDTTGDEIPDQWLSANTAWDTAAATPNWNNVVAVRVGFVLRGPVGSAQGQSSITSDNDLYPLGLAFTCGAATSCSPAAGLKFTPPNDGRLRRVFATTFFIRNSTR